LSMPLQAFAYTPRVRGRIKDLLPVVLSADDEDRDQRLSKPVEIPVEIKPMSRIAVHIGTLLVSKET
jgi:hypothetical protein